MAKWELKYKHKRVFSPLTYWVHKGVNEKIIGFYQCKDFEPSLPAKDSMHGYPYLFVDYMAFGIISPLLKDEK